LARIIKAQARPVCNPTQPKFTNLVSIVQSSLLYGTPTTCPIFPFLPFSPNIPFVFFALKVRGLFCFLCHTLLSFRLVGSISPVQLEKLQSSWLLSSNLFMMNPHLRDTVLAGNQYNKLRPSFPALTLQPSFLLQIISVSGSTSETSAWSSGYSFRLAVVSI